MTNDQLVMVIGHKSGSGLELASLQWVTPPLANSRTRPHAPFTAITTTTFPRELFWILRYPITYYANLILSKSSMSSNSEEFRLDEARSQFNELLRRFRTDKQRQDFLLWVDLEFKGTSSPGMVNVIIFIFLAICRLL